MRLRYDKVDVNSNRIDLTVLHITELQYLGVRLAALDDSWHEANLKFVDTIEFGIRSCVGAPVLLFAMRITPETSKLSTTVVLRSIRAVASQAHADLSFRQFRCTGHQGIGDGIGHQTESVRDGCVVDVSKIILCELVARVLVAVNVDGDRSIRGLAIRINIDVNHFLVLFNIRPTDCDGIRPLLIASLIVIPRTTMVLVE